METINVAIWEQEMRGRKQTEVIQCQQSDGV